MSKLPTTSMAPSTLADQAISASLTVEVTSDLDTGQPTLIAATQGNQGDLQVVTVAQAMAKVAALREQADRIEALINEYAEKVLIPAFLTEFDIELEELEIATLDGISPKVADAFQAVIATMPDGTTLVTVPTGQKPTERLAVIRDLVRYQQKQTKA